MGDQARPEKRIVTSLRAVNELINGYKMPRGHRRIKRADCRHGHQIGHAAALQYIDVSTVVDAARRDRVAHTMARQKSEPHLAQCPGGHRARWQAKRARHFDLLGVLQPDPGC